MNQCMKSYLDCIFINKESAYVTYTLLLFASEQHKRRISSHVSDDYEDVDEAEDSKNVYRGFYVLV